MRRVIFTLLHDRGRFQLSRNFRLQAIGDMRWLLGNYALPQVSRGLDELLVLDVTRGARDPMAFAAAVERIAGECFIPVTAGGGIASLDDARTLLRHGADKLLVNGAFHTDPTLCRSLADTFGRQCIVAGIDVRRAASGYDVLTAHGTTPVGVPLDDWVAHVQAHGAGELLFQSIDRDGTGMGLDLGIVDALAAQPDAPVILMGGVGQDAHIVEGLMHARVSAVATANLLNFIGDAFLDTRTALAAAGVSVARWDDGEVVALRDRFAEAA